MKKHVNHVGVWIDHHIAHFVYPKPNGEYHIESMESLWDRHPREDGQGSDTMKIDRFQSSNNEYSKHNKERDELHHYYRSLSKVLEKYDDILITGPTTAKQELFNLLLDNKAFAGKRIVVEKADKMSENQLKALVRDFFEMKNAE